MEGKAEERRWTSARSRRGEGQYGVRGGRCPLYPRQEDSLDPLHRLEVLDHKNTTPQTHRKTTIRRTFGFHAPPTSNGN